MRFTRNAVAVVGLAAATAGVTVAIFPAGGAIATSDSPPPSSMRAAPPPDADSKSAHHRDVSKGSRSEGVSAEAGRRADSHSMTDTFLSELLALGPNEVARQGTWSTLGGERIGVLREIVFTGPVDVPMRKWPSIRWNEEAAVDTYTRHQYEVEVRNLTKLTVFIDDQAGVVGVQADAGAVEIPGPNNEILNVESDH